MKPGYKTILWFLLAVSLISAYPALSARLAAESRNRTAAIVADYTSFLRQMQEDKTGQNAAGQGSGGSVILRKLKDSGITAVAIDETETGFDMDIVKEASSLGFDIMLVFKNGKPLSSVLPADYETICRKYRVRYACLQSNVLPGYPDLSGISSFIRNCPLTVALAESPDQTGLTGPDGLDGILESLRYPAGRMYVVPDADLSVLDSDELFHRWLRAVVDRSIRFIYVKPLSGSKPVTAAALSGESGNSGTLEAVKRLKSFLATHGYATGEVLNNAKAGKSAGFFSIMLIAGIFSGLLSYLEYLRDPTTRTAGSATLRKGDSSHLSHWKTARSGVPARAAAAVLFAVFACLIRAGIITAADFISISASMIYPSLSSLILMIYLKKNASKPILINLAVSIALFLAINLAGAYTISASFSGVRYTMGFETFKGVALVYTVPVILTVVSYLRVMKGWKMRLAEEADANEAVAPEISKGLPGRKLLSPVNLILITVFAVLFVVYLLRSVTEGVIRAGNFEVTIRDLLETTMVARPRFKEFLAGWPSLFGFVFLLRHGGMYKSNPLLLPLAIGFTIGGISIIDSFCHTFTAITVSLYRTANGMILGLAAGVIVLLLLTAARCLKGCW